MMISITSKYATDGEDLLWNLLEKDQCKTLGPTITKDSIYVALRFFDSTGATSEAILGDPKKAVFFCLGGPMKQKATVGNIDFCSDITKRVRYGDFQTSAEDRCTMVFDAGGVGLTCIETQQITTQVSVTLSEVANRCLVSWDDSHQVHSSDVIIEWNYQAVKTVLKRLHHCVRIRAVGPIDIKGFAQTHVENCVKSAADSSKNRGIIMLGLGIAADVASAGASGGAGTAAAITDYLVNVSDDAMACIKDTEKLGESLSDELKKQFKASVKHEQDWVYWSL